MLLRSRTAYEAYVQRRFRRLYCHVCTCCCGCEAHAPSRTPQRVVATPKRRIQIRSGFLHRETSACLMYAEGKVLDVSLPSFWCLCCDVVYLNPGCMALRASGEA